MPAFGDKPTPTQVSSGKGATTCAYFTPRGDSLVYASTYLGGKACPPKPDFSRGYVWPIYGTYDIFRAKADGSGIERLTDTPGYDAEATVGPDGRIIFTSVRDGDMELYVMDADGKNVKRLTNRVGPDGGAFFSKDGKLIVWRGKTLTDPKELDDYKALLKEGLWRPTNLEIMVANADGSNIRTVTKLPGASFAPFFTPDSEADHLLVEPPRPARAQLRHLFLVNVDGTNIERITTNESFDGFPMFSPDGRSLVFASNRATEKGKSDTNVFVARWVDAPEAAAANKLTTSTDRVVADAQWLADVSREGRASAPRAWKRPARSSRRGSRRWASRAPPAAAFGRRSR
jgi:Tol biopolymer transport system component